MAWVTRTVALAAILFASAASSAAAATELPVALDSSNDADGVRDRAGIGTGFTSVLPAAGRDPYKPELLDVDRAAGLLRLTTTSGLTYRNLNSLDNALGFQFGNDGEAVKLHASLVDIRALDRLGTYQQGGLWVGPSQDTYVKLVVISGRSGQVVHMLYESAGRVVKSIYGPPLDLTGHRVELRLRVVPATAVVTAAYSVDGGAATLLGEVVVAPALLAPDGFSAGIFGSHRRAPAPVRFDFDGFGAVCASEGCAAIPGPDPDLGDGTPPVGRPASPEGGEPPAGTPPAPTVRGKLAASLRAAARVRARALRRGLPVAVKCSLRCRYTLRVKVPPSAARRLGLTRRRAAITVSRRVAVADGGRNAKTVLRLGRRHRLALLSSSARVGLKVSLHASAGANGSVQRKRTVVLRP